MLRIIHATEKPSKKHKNLLKVHHALPELSAVGGYDASSEVGYSSTWNNRWAPDTRDYLFRFIGRLYRPLI